jgi:hypothetical protein
MERASAALWWLSATLFMLSALLWTCSRADAHGWYDPACCSERDCAPADEAVVDLPDGGVRVEGHGVLAATDPRLRRSKDFEAHVCVSASGRLLCVYQRPKGG